MNTSNKEQAKEVKPAHIGAELERMRKSLSSSLLDNSKNSSKNSNSSIRATLSNMIILVPSIEDHQSACDSISECIEGLATSHPSRFFIIEIDKNLKHPLTTSVKGRELKNPSGTLLQTEEIHISIHPDSLSLIKNLILSHLIPDIETIYLEISTGSHPFRKVLLEALSECIDTCITYAPDKEIEKSSTSLKKIDHKYICWPLLSKWRSLISEQYDSPETQKMVEKISDIFITFTQNDSETSKIPDEALALSSWMISSLHAFPNAVDRDEENRTSITCTSTTKNKTELKVHFQPYTKKSFSGVSQVRIVMQLSDRSSFETSCTYLPSIESIEVTSSGKGEALDEPSKPGDTCEFYFRRTSIQQKKTSEAILELIRGEETLDVHEVFQKLKNLSQ